MDTQRVFDTSCEILAHLYVTHIPVERLIVNFCIVNLECSVITLL